MDTDRIIREAGGCGIFQVLLVTMLCANRFPQVWGEIFMVFGSYNPGWVCADTNVTLNDTFQEIQYNEINSTADQVSDALSNIQGDCEACTNVKFNGESSTIVTEWNLVCDRYWIAPFIISIQMCGSILGIWITGFVFDAMGRRIGLFSGIALNSIFNAIAVFSNSWQMYTAVRFFIGISNGAVLVNAHPYLLEFVDSRWRSVLTAIPEWNVGSATFAIAAWILKDWRHLHIVSAIQAALCFMAVFWIPESMRWLAVHNKVPQAKLVMEKICRVNRMPTPNTDFLDDIAEEERKHGRKSAYTYLDLLRAGLRHKSIAVFLLWFLLSLSYFAINFGIKSLSGNFYLNFFLFPWIGIPGMFFVPLLANKLGRKWAIISLLVPGVVMSYAVVVSSFVAPVNVHETATTVLAFLTSSFLDISWMVDIVYVGELFPTVVRSLAFGVSVLGIRLGSVAAPYLIPSGSENIYISYSIMGSALLVCCGLVLSLPETGKKPLEDTIKPKDVTLLHVREHGADDNDDEESKEEIAI